MAKAPTHITAPRKQHEITLTALVCGGFVVNEGRRRDGEPAFNMRDQLGAFTTLDEALGWLRLNMDQPATPRAGAQA